MSDANQKLTELINDAKIGMLTTMTPDGQHHSRPMGLQEVEFDGDLWFFTYQSSSKVTDIQANPNVNVSFTNKGANSWVSLTGDAEATQDMAKAKELWTPFMKAWFPDGLETEGLTLIKVHATSAEYWDAPNSIVITLFGMAKAAVTGETPKGGENKSLNL